MNFYADLEFARTVQQILEFVGTFAFAISGIRHAAGQKFDWFGGFVCGVAVAIGGGTIRDVMLGVTPFWMTSPVYLICTALAQVFVVIFKRYLRSLDNAWFVFDTLGLALFTIAGIQKTLALGHPFWVAVIMGCLTGAAGGVIRDVLLNKQPVIFQKEIYASASIGGGLLYWGMIELGVNVGFTALATFSFICLIRFFAVRYHISLPVLTSEDNG